jgi:hypothetical protein
MGNFRRSSSPSPDGDRATKNPPSRLRFKPSSFHPDQKRRNCPSVLRCKAQSRPVAPPSETFSDAHTSGMTLKSAETDGLNAKKDRRSRKRNADEKIWNLTILPSPLLTKRARSPNLGDVRSRVVEAREGFLRISTLRIAVAAPGGVFNRETQATRLREDFLSLLRGVLTAYSLRAALPNAFL